MKRSTKGFIGATLITAGIMGAAGTALAYQGDPDVKGRMYSSERHAAMQQAFETNDYDLWKSLMQGRGRVAEAITAENFSRFAEAHRLMLEGDAAGARVVMEELGLRGAGAGRGLMKRMGAMPAKGERMNFVDANADGVCDRMQ